MKNQKKTKNKIIASGRVHYFYILLITLFTTLIFQFFELYVVLIGCLIVGFIALVIAYIFAQNHYIEFEENEIHAQIGLINTRNLFAPYDNIDHVEIKSDLIMKILQLCELRIDTTGRGDTEIKMKNIPYSEAKEAVKIIKSKRDYNELEK